MVTKEPKQKIKIAALGDIHVKETSQGAYKELFEQISREANILALCGDLTDLGLIEEGELLINELKSCRIPIVAVLGNHDYESGLQSSIHHMLLANKVNVLHGTEYVFEKYGRRIAFTGVKGFGGGFIPYMWGRFGEPEQKAFYDAIASEVQQLEIGLSRIQSLEADERFVLLHFSPIRATVEGDIVEMYPFLGSSRLEEVIDRYEVTAVLHGHSHHGGHQGKTARNIPVYNVAYPMMKKLKPEEPFFIYEV